MFTDVNSFSRALSGKQDSNFYTLGQLCRFVRKLCARCFVGTSLPKDDDWDQLLSLTLLTLPQLPSKVFLQRLGLEEKVRVASKQKAESEICDKGNKSATDKLCEKLQEDFAIMGREYIRHLLRNVLRHVSLTTELVRGLSSFDPRVLFCQPMSVGTKYFTVLYRSFSSRKWVDPTNEQLCLDEYLSFMDKLRTGYPYIVESPDLVFDIVDLLTPMASLRERPHLLYLFKLCCLCLTSNISDFIVVELGSTNSSLSSCKVRESIFPVLSYVANVPDCVQPCITSDSLSQFATLRSEFGPGGFTSLYSPWNSVDFGGHTKIYKSLREVYSNILRRRSEAPSTSGVAGRPAVKESFSQSVVVEKTSVTSQEKPPAIVSVLPGIGSQKTSGDPSADPKSGESSSKD